MAVRRGVFGPRALRALAHPLRVRLYELISVEGDLTSTRAAQLTGENTATCSFHLRQLAKYGFIEAAAAAGPRERPWRRTTDVNRFEARGTVAEQLATEIAIARILEQSRDFLSRQRDHPKQWQQAAFVSDALVYLLPSELAALKRTVLRATRPYVNRTADPRRRPPKSRPVSLLAIAIPLASTGRES